MKAKLLVTGSAGQLGSEFCELLAERFVVVGINREDADITDFGKISRIINQQKPKYVIHTAAFTDVDACELNPDKAHQVNVLGTENVARAANEVGAVTVHFSTDYVFDGEKAEAYIESDETNPLSVYGSSKRQSEKVAKELGVNNIIIRTGWLYGRNGNNFVKKILSLANGTAKPLRVVNDQFGSPTWTRDVVEQTARIIESGQKGIFHVASKGELSRYEFAKLVLKELLPCAEVQPCLTIHTNRPAKRPPRSTLASMRLNELGIDVMRTIELSWSEFMNKHAEELIHEIVN